VGTRKDAALAQVVAARGELDDQVDRLEASARAAVDVPARIRRSPGKAAAVVGGAAFLAVGGPKRLFRRARKAVTGHADAPLPKSLLPKDIDKALKRMGTDGDKVRGTIERDFSKYLDVRAKERQKEGIQAALTAVLLTALRPVGKRAGRQVAERLFDPNAPGFEEQLRKIRERRAAVETDVKDAAEGSTGSGVGL
jgi:hypothetical protein